MGFCLRVLSKGNCCPEIGLMVGLVIHVGCVGELAELTAHNSQVKSQPNTERVGDPTEVHSEMNT